MILTERYGLSWGSSRGLHEILESNCNSNFKSRTLRIELTVQVYVNEQTNSEHGDDWEMHYHI